MEKDKIRIALVCTIGGHFEQLSNLFEFYNKYYHFWITNKNKQTESHLVNEEKYYIPMAHFKKPWTYFYQLPFFLKIFVSKKPTYILSTGSGRTAFIAFLLSKYFKIKFVYIDTFSRVIGYSKFGEFLLKVKEKIYTQWKDEDNKNAIYIGPVFHKSDSILRDGNKNLVFITVGTRDEPFTRLLNAVELLIQEGIIRERVIVQAGHTKYSSVNMELFDFCSPDKVDELILKSKYVITQESAGTGTKCLKFNTKFIVMPRDYAYKELPSKSDMKEDLHLKLEELGYTRVVHNIQELKNAIQQLDKIKTGFKFDNQLAISTLTKIVEDK